MWLCASKDSRVKTKPYHLPFPKSIVNLLLIGWLLLGDERVVVTCYHNPREIENYKTLESIPAVVAWRLCMVDSENESSFIS